MAIGVADHHFLVLLPAGDGRNRRTRRELRHEVGKLGRKSRAALTGPGRVASGQPERIVVNALDTRNFFTCLEPADTDPLLLRAVIQGRTPDVVLP